MRGLAILGSTGSIGDSALEVAAAAPERFRVIALAAGHNVERLAAQVRRFRPELVSVRREADRRRLLQLLNDAPEVLCGVDGACAVAAHPAADVVLGAMVGAAGLQPTLAALERGGVVALANKEPLVMAGALCVARAREHGTTLLPVDSEHNAIFQALQGRAPGEVRRLLLTGSGGPLREVQDLASVTPEQALAHPTWSMGPKISIDSATLMNKGLEVIEARWLFDMPAERIEVLIHPQCTVHALVELTDGSLLAQLGHADMRIPIAHALSFPRRLDHQTLGIQPLDLTELGPLSFEAPDTSRFPCLALAYRALEQGGTCPAALNAANEVAVQAFLERQIGFHDIPAVIQTVLDQHPAADDQTLEALLQADHWAREAAHRLVDRRKLQR